MHDTAVHRGERSIAIRSVVVSGRRTSITLEDAFWDAMHEIAEAKCMTRPRLIREINKTRSHANLSSAIRVFVLAYYQGLEIGNCSERVTDPPFTTDR
jgi:predicted DNA-binding ribbon-helix-helix protein